MSFAIELATVAVVVALSVGLHALLQSRVKPETLLRNNEVAGEFFHAVGIIYAVLLGFVVVVVWEKYDTTVVNVDTEIAAVTDLYRVSAGLPAPVREKVRAELISYVDTIIKVEWPNMADRAKIPNTLGALEVVANEVDTFSPKTLGESNAQQAATGQVLRLFDARRLRLVESLPSVPGILWFALYAGGIAIVAFAYFFGLENRVAQLMMTGILVGLIGILFIVISEFDGPFHGVVSISDSGWRFLAKHLVQIP